MSDVTATSPAAVESAGARPKPKRLLGIDDKYIAPILITCILLVGHFTAGILKSPVQMLTAIGVCILVEVVLGLLFTARWPFWASAFVTGNSLGILVQATDVWPYALAAAIAITSKYALRVKGRHLWNPSNFAICVMLIIAPEYVATLSVEFGNAIWASLVIWVVGALIISKLKRFHICLTYAAGFFFFAALRTVMFAHGWNWHAFEAEVAPITGPMYQLFIFFMITDPKTTVKSRRAQIVVAFMVAAAECVLRIMGNVHAPYFALTIVGPIAMLWQIALDSRKAAPAR